MKLAIHRRPANPRTPIDPNGTYLSGRDHQVELDFSDIRRMPDPDWARPTSERHQRWAQGRAEQAYAEIGPYGPVILSAKAAQLFIDQGNRVAADIENSLAEIRALCEHARAGVVRAAVAPPSSWCDCSN